MKISKKIEGTKIICEYTSSNIKKGIYDTSNKELELEFNSGSSYIYENVPHETFTAFDMAESQGKHFNKNFKEFKYRKK